MTLLIIELMTTAALVTLIWIIQILHYPSFRFVKTEAFCDFARFHSKRISFIVIPLMFLELGLGIYFMNIPVLVILAAIWGSTFLLQVPCHNEFARKHNSETIERLIKTNWIRTIGWTLKFVLLIRNFPWSLG